MASEFVAKPLPRKPQPPCASGDVTALLLQNGRYQTALDVAHNLVNTHALARSRYPKRNIRPGLIKRSKTVMRQRRLQEPTGNLRYRLLLKQQDETPYNALKLPDVPRKWEPFEEPSHHLINTGSSDSAYRNASSLIFAMAGQPPANRSRIGWVPARSESFSSTSSRF